jgi:hypothetical protein
VDVDVRPDDEHQAAKPKRLADLPRSRWGLPGITDPNSWSTDIASPTIIDLTHEPIPWRNRP